MRGVFEIRHVDNAGEPTFEVWLRRVVLEPVQDDAGNPQAVDLQHVYHQLAPAGSPRPPRLWPIPADSESNLAEALPWYLERLIQQPTQAACQHARNVLRALNDWGRQVFQQLYNTETARSAHDRFFDGAAPGDVRIEIHSHDHQVLAWPWEALVDHDDWIVGKAAAIERRFLIDVPNAPTHEPRGIDGRCEVLLITARAGPTDVDYRVIGNSLANYSNIRLTLLRPATLERLRELVRTSDRQWDVLHIDAHGWWGSLEGTTPHGYILLEDGSEQLRPVSAADIVEAMGSHCPSHVVLNTCRSAMVDGQALLSNPSPATDFLRHPNVHDVTAMALNLQVDAANSFFPVYYGALIGGEPASHATHFGRLMMMREPERTCVGGSIALEDWLIPVVYRRPGGLPVDDVVHNNPGLKEEQTRNINFVGRDDVILQLDRCVESPTSIVLLHGLAGQGKTALLHEFLRWRLDSGDERPSIWIDFEQISTHRDVLWQIAEAFPNPPDHSIDLGPLEDYVAHLLKENSSWVVWDHVHVVRAEDERGSLGNLSLSERTRLSLWLERLHGGRSAILAASRGPEPWLPQHWELPIRGLSEGDRWRLIRRILGTKQEGGDLQRSTFIPFTTAEQSLPRSQDSDKSEDDTFSSLIYYIAGHTLITLDAIARVREGISPEDVYHGLQSDISGLRPWLLESSDATRIEQSLACLTEEAIRPLAPLLSLHEELIDEDLLRQMLARTHSGAAERMVHIGLSRLETNGLLHQRAFLLPGVTGSLRADNTMVISEDERRAFVVVIAECIAKPRDADKPLMMTIQTLQSAFTIALSHRLLEAAELLGRHIANSWLQRRLFARALEVKRQVGLMYGENSTATEAIRASLSTAEVARLGRNLEEATKWLSKSQAQAQASSSELPLELRADLLIQTGMIARLRGDFAEYKDAMQQAQKLLEQSDNTQMKSLVAFEMSQIAVLDNDADSLSKHAPEVQIESGSSGLSALGYRALAQAELFAGELDAARIQLRRSIAISQQIGNPVEKAMSISLLGEVEAKEGNLDRAEELFQEAASAFEVAGDRHSAGVTYNACASAYYAHNRMEEAGEYFIHSAKCFLETGDTGSLGVLVNNFKTYLKANSEPGVTYMRLKWIAAGLPQLFENDFALAFQQTFDPTHQTGEDLNRGNPTDASD